MIEVCIYVEDFYNGFVLLLGCIDFLCFFEGFGVCMDVGI